MAETEGVVQYLQLTGPLVLILIEKYKLRGFASIMYTYLLPHDSRLPNQTNESHESLGRTHPEKLVNLGAC